MPFAVYHMLMIILHQCRIHPDCLPGSINKQCSRNVIVNIKYNLHLFKRRKAIFEHPYGTIKRQWGYSYILTKKGKAKASADVGLMFIVCNLRRIGNILTMNVLKEYLRILSSLFKYLFHLKWVILKLYKGLCYVIPDRTVEISLSLKSA